MAFRVKRGAARGNTSCTVLDMGWAFVLGTHRTLTIVRALRFATGTSAQFDPVSRWQHALGPRAEAAQGVIAVAPQPS
jgi:hypothetical protein